MARLTVDVGFRVVLAPGWRATHLARVDLMGGYHGDITVRDITNHGDIIESYTSHL